MIRRLIILSMFLTVCLSIVWDARISALLSSGESVRIFELILRHGLVVIIGAFHIVFLIRPLRKFKISGIDNSRTQPSGGWATVLLVLVAVLIIILGFYGLFHAFFLKDKLTVFGRF